MLHTLRSRRGMAVAPHHLAAQAGRDVLRDGGSASEATVRPAWSCKGRKPTAHSDPWWRTSATSGPWPCTNASQAGKTVGGTLAMV